MITLSENFRALFYTPLYAAHAIGAYQAEKVEVHLRDSPDPARSAADLRAGRIDVMWGGPLRVVLTQAGDPTSDVVCFCDVVARDPFFIVGREPNPHFRPHHLQNIRFASVAEVPTPWLCLQDDIRRDGADPAALNRTNGPLMAENTAALKAGQLDAIQVFQPYAEDLLQSGTGHLWSAAADRGLTAYTTLVTRRSVLTERRDELAAMVRAMDRTLRWIATTPGAEIARALAGFFPDVPAPIYAAAMDRYRALNLYAVDPMTRREGVQRLQEAMISGGVLNRIIPFEQVVDNSLAQVVVTTTG
jgi:NitT/TauT family transport system substrate-binding protein